MRMLLVVALCVPTLGCAKKTPPLPPADYKKNIEDQLGITRARQRAEACRTRYAPAIGMTEAKVVASCWGAADHAAESVTAQGKKAVWSYPEGYVYLTNGIVTKIITSR